MASHKKTIIPHKMKETALLEGEGSFPYSVTDYRTFLEDAPDIIFIVDLEGKFLFINKTAKKITGHPLSKFLESSLKDVVTPEYQDSILKALRDSHQNNNASFEVETTSAKGEKILLDIRLNPIKNKKSDVIALQGVAREITGRKRRSRKAEEKIKEVNRQLERFSEISAAILSIEDEEELFSYIARAVVEISDFQRVLISYFIDKFPSREIIGHKGVKGEDLERVRKVEMPREKFLAYFDKGIKIGRQSCYIPHYLKDILDQKALIPGEKKYPKKKDSWHREDNLLVCMKDTKDEIIGMISVDDSKSGKVPTEETVRPLEIFANLISEIIQRRKLAKEIADSELKYRELVGNIKVGIFRASPDGKIFEANPALIEMFGFNSSEKFLNLKTTDLFNNPNDNEHLLRGIQDNVLVKNIEFLMKKGDGRMFWASVTSSAVKNPLGKIIYYDTVLEDITDRKNLQEEVRRLSITDELTRLYNRRYFNQKLPVYIKAAENFRSSLSLIMIDIDDFKPYNDTYHHLEGDEVIKEIARIIHQNIRKDKDENWIDRFGDDQFPLGDWASRFGGDEFAIILPGQTSSDSTVVAERIREIFKNTAFKPREEPVYKTISLGIASCHYAGGKQRSIMTKKIFPPHYEKIATELITLADKALFRAKKSGNKVVSSKISIELSRTGDLTK